MTVTVCVTVAVELPPVVDVPVSLTLPVFDEVEPVFDEVEPVVVEVGPVFVDEMPDEVLDDELGQVDAVVKPLLVVDETEPLEEEPELLL